MARRLRAAVQGEAGCFSHQAAVDHFGALDLVACRDFGDMFDAVMDGRADLACVPVENALAGAVTETHELLVRYPVVAVAETYVRVEMCLAVRPGTRLEELTAVGSHPVALRQCRRFLQSRPLLEEVVAHDTAGSIRDLMHDPGAHWNGAIGPALAAELYGAEILLTGIEDHPRNFTRFLIVVRRGTGQPAASRPASPGTASKASLAMTLPHRPGALQRALGVLAAQGLDLTRLESRPIPGRPWEYRFFADVSGAAGDPWHHALDALRSMASELRLIGRYPEATPP